MRLSKITLYTEVCRRQTGFSPSLLLFSKRHTSAPLLVKHHQTTIRSYWDFGCQTELIPVHSPLLGESYLVSSPPLTYMLKFSRFARLPSCLEYARVICYVRAHEQARRCAPLVCARRVRSTYLLQARYNCHVFILTRKHAMRELYISQPKI